MSPRALLLTAVALVVGVALDLLIGYSPFPGYGALLGLLGSVGIILGSRWLGRLLARPEDHYPADVPADLQEDQRG